MKDTEIRLAIIGLGYVGLPLAVAFGRQMPVVGFDTNHRRIEDLRAGRDRTLEVASEDLHGATQLKYSANATDLRDCNVFIVTVPTPVDSANRPDLSHLLSASETVGRAMPSGAIVIYESTVYPGATEEVCVPALERASGQRFNEGFFCGYSPERVNPGDKVNTLTKIRKITSGSTPTVAETVDHLYNRIVTAGTYKAQSIRVAEAAKVIENTQRDLNIALMNELSVLFDRLGIDTLEVLEAAGSKWNFLPFRPGLVGGHCIGVDPYYLTHKAEQVGYIPQIILAGRRINDNMARYAAGNTIKLMLQAGMDVPRCKIGVMGITFKENCPDIRNSKVIDLVRELESWGAQVVVTDPWADTAEVQHEYGVELGEINEGSQVDALVVAVGHTQYRVLSPEVLRRYCRHSSPVLTDVKSLYDRHQATKTGFTVFRL
jgi:UDP-N-acetyl-D-galactosamine dehydrogenase